MALEFNQLLDLMKTVAKAEPSAPTAYSFGQETYSYDDLQNVLRQECQELAGSYALYRRNKNTIFELIEKTMDDVLPKKILDEYGKFAEVIVIGQGDKYVFKRRIGKVRAKQFITRVGLAGIYEVFKLGTESYTIQTSAIGGAAAIGFEEWLDGRVDLSELFDIVMEGMSDLIYREIAQALSTSLEQLPATNKVQATGFDEAEFDRLLATASAYGVPTIYCTYEFATTMMPNKDWVSENMKNDRWANGYFTRYKGHPVVILPQSFEDETNATKIIDPSFCWIIPAGADAKPAKVVVEGNTIVDEFENRDRSREIQVYKKVGVGVTMTPDICVYRQTSLKMANAAGKWE